MARVTYRPADIRCAAFDRGGKLTTLCTGDRLEHPRYPVPFDVSLHVADSNYGWTDGVFYSAINGDMQSAGQILDRIEEGFYRFVRKVARETVE